MSGTLPGTKDVTVSKVDKALDLFELVRAPELWLEQRPRILWEALQLGWPFSFVPI